MTKTSKKDCELAEDQLRVEQVGWNDQALAPMILVRKKDRARLGLETKSVVAVEHGKNKSLGMAHIQFWEHVSKPKACTLNECLAKRLDAVEGDVIKITGVASAVESEAFLAEYENAIRQGLQYLSSLPERISPELPLALPERAKPEVARPEVF